MLENNLSPSLLVLVFGLFTTLKAFPYDTGWHQLFLAAGKTGTLGKVLQQRHSETQETTAHHQEGLVYVTGTTK